MRRSKDWFRGFSYASRLISKMCTERRDALNNDGDRYDRDCIEGCENDIECDSERIAREAYLQAQTFESVLRYIDRKYKEEKLSPRVQI